MQTATESGIITALDKILPRSALSYKQVLQDLDDDERVSYRGTAGELREVVRELLDRLAPDAEVLKTTNLEKGRSGPTMQQKATFILKDRRVSDKARKTAEDGIAAFEYGLARSVYNRGSASVHGDSNRQEVRGLKTYADAVLGELLEIGRIPLGSAETSEIPGGRRQPLEIWKTRAEWWANIPSIIKNSSKLVVIESYFGNHHLFWDSLEERLRDKEQFHFVLLTLRKGSPALRNVLELSGASPGVVQNDRVRIQRLEKLLAESTHREKKTLEFLTWNGYGPGSVIWWIADGKESVGLGCWLQYPGNTDKTPWIVFRQGLLFEYLTDHCKNTADLARSSATSQSGLGTRLKRLLCNPYP